MGAFFVGNASEGETKSANRPPRPTPHARRPVPTKIDPVVSIPQWLLHVEAQAGRLVEPANRWAVYEAAISAAKAAVGRLEALEAEMASEMAHAGWSTSQIGRELGMSRAQAYRLVRRSGG